MVDRAIVEKIIRDNNVLPQKEQTDESDSFRMYTWEQEKWALRDYIAGLPFEEILDIVALMDCGRECIQMQSRATKEIFKEKRSTIAADHVDAAEREHLAIYLLKKGKFLSDCLQRALSVYD